MKESRLAGLECQFTVFTISRTSVKIDDDSRAVVPGRIAGTEIPNRCEGQIEQFQIVPFVVQEEILHPLRF